MVIEVPPGLQGILDDFFQRPIPSVGEIDGRKWTGDVGAFAVLPPQDLRIGNHICHQISFVTPAGNKNRYTPKIQVDGLLTTGLFRRVYISYADRFVVLEPW